MHCVCLTAVAERHFKRGKKKKKQHLLPLPCLNSRERFNCTFRLKPNCLHQGLPDVAMSRALPQDAREREKQSKKKTKNPCSPHTVLLGVQSHLCATTPWNDRHNNSHYFASSAWLWALPAFWGQTRGNNECCQAGYPFWQHRSAEGMNGTMARNDITVPLISCQFETSAVFIFEQLFVFIIGGPLSRRPNGSIPSLSWPSSHHSGAICCFASRENDISKISAFIYLFLQSVFIVGKVILLWSSVNAFCTERREMFPTETS